MLRNQMLPSPSPSDSLESMDQRLQRMADFKAAFNDSVGRDVAKHVRHRNSLLPIEKLPTELLQTIFSLLLFSPRGRRKSRFVSRLTTLRAVSWSWRDLIGRTTSFWAHVSSEDHKDFVSEALERSDQAPLHFKHIGKRADGPECLFLEKVLPHAHRWESAAIHQPNIHVAAKYFSASSLKIKIILLSGVANGTYQPGHIGNLFGGDLASLEELRVHCWGGIDWRGVSCTRLRILDIEREHSLDMGAILDILAANPYLEVFRLSDVGFAQYPQPDPIPAPIPLDHLTQLTLAESIAATDNSFSGSSVGIGYILQRIRFPTGTAFTVRTELQTNPPLTPEKFISMVPSPAEALARLPLVDGLQRANVNVKFGGCNFLFRIQDDPRSQPAFSVAVSGLPEQVAKEWVVDTLRQASTTPMDLRLRFGSSQSSFSLDAVFYFQLWESVVDLTLMGNPQTPPDVGRDLLRLLSTPCMSEDGVMVMPFPKLKHLRISDVPGTKGKYMLAMAQARFAPPGPAEAAGRNVVPVPLTFHCGNGVGAWGSNYQDKILAVPGVEGIRDGVSHPAPRIARSSSPTVSEPDWPPSYGPSGARLLRIEEMV